MKMQIQILDKSRFGNLKNALLVLIFIAGFALTANSQSTSKQEAEIAKLRTQLERARVAHEKQEKKVQIADSLITVGSTMREESSDEIKAAVSAMKARNKEYSTQRKSLEKRLKSKSREDVAEAKAEIKTLDAEYKAELKAHDALMKAQNKKSADGTKNLERGKTMKKEAGKMLKETSRNLTNAQYALEDAIEIADEGAPVKGKKGKKK